MRQQNGRAEGPSQRRDCPKEASPMRPCAPGANWTHALPVESMVIMMLSLQQQQQQQQQQQKQQQQQQQQKQQLFSRKH
ncbi:GH19514 [Drosophila grimshawi]|uniref:GH19514 n=1 Tax=Drosophila grimshawi TaxID=7222 RepID=B4JGZ5_DROGR|nr:GH19514 [Drosophila grimshawi]